MKKITSLAACMAIASLCLSQKTASQTRSKSGESSRQLTYELSEAVAKKLVLAEFDCSGGAARLLLRLKTKGPKAVRVRASQGQLFEPADPGAQTLVNAEEKSLFVSAKAPVEAVLKTFCIEPSDYSARAGTVFSVGAMASVPVLKMLNELSKLGKMEAPEAQSAIWAVCEGSSFNVAGIGDDALTRSACQTLSRPVPTYRIRYETREAQPGERAFLGKALVVEGNYRYFLEKDERLSMALFDAEGRVVKKLFENRSSTKGEHRSSLRLEVHGLKQGNYSVKLTTASGAVMMQQDVAF